jgi:heme exporter protein D
MAPSADYVWSAYLISIAGLAVAVAATWAKWLAAKKRLALLKDSETNL